MAWEWSHSNTGLENARENLFQRSIKTLIEIRAEWDAWNGEGSSISNFDLDTFKRRKKELSAAVKSKQLAHDALADDIWDKMCQLRTCTNGGHYAYACPFGCHQVSFSTFAERMAEAKARKKG